MTKVISKSLPSSRQRRTKHSHPYWPPYPVPTTLNNGQSAPPFTRHLSKPNGALKPPPIRCSATKSSRLSLSPPCKTTQLQNFPSPQLLLHSLPLLIFYPSPRLRQNVGLADPAPGFLRLCAQRKPRPSLSKTFFMIRDRGWLLILLVAALQGRCSRCRRWHWPASVSPPEAEPSCHRPGSL